jgi:hypothetical protein
LDGKLQESLHEFLEARGINDKLAVFLHKYMKNKDKTEFHSCVKSFIEKQASEVITLPHSGSMRFGWIICARA